MDGHFRYHFAHDCLVLFVISVVDVLVAKVMKQRTSWRPSSLGCEGLEQIRIFSVDARWRSWRVVLTGEQGGEHWVMKRCRSERRGGVGSALGGRLLLCFLLSWLGVVVGLAIAGQKFESCVVRRVRDSGVRGVDRAGPRVP